MPKIDRSSSDLEELPAPPIKPSSNFKTRLLYVAIETNKYCGTVASIIFWLGRPVVRFQQLRHRHKNCRMTDMEILTRLTGCSGEHRVQCNLNHGSPQSRFSMQTQISISACSCSCVWRSSTSSLLDVPGVDQWPDTSFS